MKVSEVTYILESEITRHNYIGSFCDQVVLILGWGIKYGCTFRNGYQY